MATVAKWEEELKWHPIDELKEIENALLTLENWDMFTHEFGEITLLRRIVRNIITNRKR